MRVRPLRLALAGILAVAGSVGADSITLRDGTILGGVVRQVKDGYEITAADGKTSFVPIDSVKSIKLSNAGKTSEQDGKERLASLRRSVESETQIPRIIDRYKQFIEMNKGTEAATAAGKDLEQWESRKAQEMVKVGAKWMTPKERDQYLVDSAKRANEIADQIAAGDIAGAMQRVAQGLEENPANLSLAYLDGVLQLRRNRHNEAKRSFDVVSEQIPDHPPTLYNQAALAAHFKRWPNAIGLFEKVMTLAPGQPEILNGVTEFLRLVPEASRRNAAFDRLAAIYNRQEAALEAQMAKKSLYRFGSAWANQATLDEMKKKLAEFEEKKKSMQSDYDASQEKIKQIARDIDRIDSQLNQLEFERIRTDPVSGRTIYMPRPQIYYDLQAERDRYLRDLSNEQTKSEDLKRQAKELEAQAPKQPFKGEVEPIGEAGVPILLPASAPQTTPPPGTAPPTTTPVEEEKPILTPLLPTTQPQ